MIAVDELLDRVQRERKTGQRLAAQRDKARAIAAELEAQNGQLSARIVELEALASRCDRLEAENARMKAALSAGRFRRFLGLFRPNGGA